jgi:hypothetical protein
MHLARFRWGSLARALSGAFKGCPAGSPLRGAELHKPRFFLHRGAEASGLERDARAGISPINSKPPVLAFIFERIIRNERWTPRGAVAKPQKGQASGCATSGPRPRGTVQKAASLPL